MLKLQQAVKRDTEIQRPKIGLAIAGGGPLGAIYELGVLRALEECMDGIDFTDLDAYVGVSAGSFIAAGLANGISPGNLCRIFINDSVKEHPFKPELFLQPAFAEYWQRASRLPAVILRSLLNMARHPLDMSLTEQLGNLGVLIPSGMFDNKKAEKFVRDIFAVPGRSNDFRELGQKLFIVAVDLDTGAAVRFGDEGTDHVPISQAIQASAALPGLYPPVAIEGRYYLDGALRRTLHASAALDQGVDLLIGLNPLVPFDAVMAEAETGETHESIVEGGLPLVLSQTFRAMIQSRMQIGIKKYRNQYPQADLLLLEPDRKDTRMFFTNVFSYASRRELCQHAYQKTRSDLLRNFKRISTSLERHGIELRRDILEQSERTFATGLSSGITGTSHVASNLQRTLDQLESIVERP
jgi:predicted acylesterase/phospholipase RssA